MMFFNWVLYSTRSTTVEQKRTGHGSNSLLHLRNDIGGKGLVVGVVSLMQEVQGDLLPRLVLLSNNTNTSRSTDNTYM